MPDDTMDKMGNDLRPLYERGPVAAGITRDTLAEIVAFHRGELLRLESIQQGCEYCQKLGPRRWCKHWRDTVPDEAVEAGCDAWQWSGVAF